MASPVRTLTVNFVGNTKALDKAFKRVSKGSSLMSDRMARAASIGMGAFAGIGTAVAGAVMTLKPMVAAAADVEESLSKNRVLFGDAAAAAERFAESSASAIGMSRRDALEAVGVFGSLAHAMGMPQAEGVDLSVTMTKLAADMASFGNVGVEETLTALQAGLRGEAEPLRRFGVLLDAATLKTKALQMGLVDNEKKALTPQAKALAAYEVILEQTLIQQDDFIRTSDGLANQQKILGATFDNLSVKVGEKILPAFTSLVSYINDNVVPALEDFVDEPSAAGAGSMFGEIFWGAFGDKGPSAEIMVGTGPTAMLDYDKAGRMWSEGFWDFVYNFFAAGGPDGGKNLIPPEVMEATGTKLEEMFAEIAANFGVDISDVINREGRRNEPPPGGDVVPGFGAGPPNAVVSDPLGGFTSQDIQGTGAGLVAVAEAQAANLAAEAQLAEMNEALGAAQQGQLDVAEAFAELLSEMEDLRLVGMGEEDITGTGAGLIEVADAQIEAAAKVDEITSFLSTHGGQTPGGRNAPSPVNITINAPAVTGKEVIDAMAEAVKQNGPFSRQWVGQ